MMKQKIVIGVLCLAVAILSGVCIHDRINNSIVVKIDNMETVPKYINEKNIQYDTVSFSEFYRSDLYDENEKTVGWDKIYNIDGVQSYIKERLDDKINIDQTYKNITKKLYIGNYLGFKDYNNMKNFSDFDLYDTYMRVLPNKIVLIFCYIISALFTIFIIFYIVKAFRFKVVNNKAIPQYKAILTYLVSTLGLFIYILYEYINIYKTKRALDYTKIEADPFLKDLLLEIQGRHCSESIIIVVLILFSFSFGAFILNRIIFVYCKVKNSKPLENNEKLIIST